MKQPALAIAALALALTGCSSDPVTSVGMPGEPPPAPHSPAAVVRLVEWAWNERDTTAIHGAFAGNFVFQFAALDSFGSAYRSTPWTYSDELVMSRRIFGWGSLTEPPAIHCDVQFDPVLAVENDPRPGRNPTWHKMIQTHVAVQVMTGHQEYRVTGQARFFTVRGDSAVLPPGDTGQYPMDSTRWLIERWEDETLPQGAATVPGTVDGRARPAQAQDTRNWTWGAIKAIYRSDSPIAPAP